MAELTPVSPNTLPFARVVIDRTMRSLAPVLRDTTIEPIVDGAVRGEWVHGPKASRTDAIILYVHGGGFIAGSVLSYRGVTSRLSTATRLPVFAVDYRLAPEHPFPAAPHDVARAYRWLRARYPAKHIVVAGDSAGGYLAADLAITNARNRSAAPAALLLFSPMTDLSLEIAASHEAADQDGIISVPVATAAIAHFTTDRLELRPAPGTSLPPTLIHTSDSELFAADAIALAERLRAAGAVCELEVWPDQMHVFHALPALVPEARTAYRAAARFVSDILDATTRTERLS
ncbi:alpha/beta hydrolase [Nocardia vinacea]|uniref:alpha/beta hydrolase n=1 Tax=Nocardia vinacea TaxID=96468 RepID=UPI00146A488D|nr:alpha/beta hydrolase [Nocardia vinacea]